MATSGIIYFRIRGVNLGLIEDKPDSLYAIQIYNPTNGNKTKYCTFHFKNQRNFTGVFSIDLVNSKTQTFTIYIYKCHTFRKELLGELIIPISSYPLDKVCFDVLEVKMAKKKLPSPISVVLDVHVNTNGAPKFSAPPGESQLAFFDIDQFRAKMSIQNDFVIAPRNKVRAATSVPLLVSGYN